MQRNPSALDKAITVFASAGKISKFDIIHLEWEPGIKELGVFIKKRAMDDFPIVHLARLAFSDLDLRPSLSQSAKQQIIARYIKTAASMAQPLILRSGPRRPLTKKEKKLFTLRDTGTGTSLIGLKSIEKVPFKNLPLYIGYPEVTSLMTKLIQAGNQKGPSKRIIKELVTKDSF